nr:ABC transporter C family member 8 [Ipomoea batatas]
MASTQHSLLGEFFFNAFFHSSANLILRAIARLYWKEMVLGGFYLLLRSAAVVVAPLLLYAFVAYSNLESKELSKGFFLVGCLIVDKVVDSLSNRHFFFYTKSIGMRIRSGLMVAVYQKQLKLSNQGRQRHSTGEVVNYIAIDAYRMGESAMWFHVGWISGLQILLSICVLFWVETEVSSIYSTYHVILDSGLKDLKS